MTITPFDVFTAPLAEVNLLEASAGTGKTWNICAVYMRLLLERNLPVSQILVVTFTKSATAELRERVRARVVETLRYVAATGPASDDPFVPSLVASAERAGVTGPDMITRLELALQSFDEAAIFTIHGFCQRALADTPFAAGVPFELELLPNDEEIHLEVAQDFWRRHVADVDCQPALAAWLMQRKDSPAAWAALLRKRTAKPLARLRWPDDIEREPVIDSRRLERAFARARATWQGSRAEIEAALRQGSGGLNKSRYKPEALAQAFDQWQAHFATGDVYAPLDFKDARLGLCRASTLDANTNDGRPTPEHPFYREADELFLAHDELEGELTLARLRLLRRLLEWAPQEVRARKRQKRVLGYDDILFDLYEALHGKPDAGALAASLRARFPAALIDEFQDTDPVQFGIFRAIYGATASPVFLVGDPKQAIYSFRNADLYTYLDARTVARREYTLEENQRSTGDLIDAVNALFDANRNAFMLEGLAYHGVRKGAKPRKSLRDTSSAPRSHACVWLLPHPPQRPLLPRRDAFDAAVQATSSEISRLLHEARAGRITYDGQALAPGHIAVLVRSHAQGTMIRNALRELDIGSVELSQESVFSTADAEEVERLLVAVVEPARAGLVKGALATELMGCDAADIEAIGADEARLVAEMDAFRAYGEIWSGHGFGVMYRRLLSERGVTARMLSRPDGERRLTNLLHLGELLQEVAQANPAPAALLRWLHAQRTEVGIDEAAQLRLESDRNLVQIVTIHKAKGLEYPVVFCPFLWDGLRRNNKESPCAYHDRDGRAVLDFRDDDDRDPAVGARMAVESLAESVRLMYVALTRASHRLYVIAGCYAQNRTQSSATQSTRSLLNWLVAGDGVSPDAWCDSKSRRPVEEIVQAWQALAKACRGKLTLDALPEVAAQRLADDAPRARELSARTPPFSIPLPWRISSYTGLSFVSTTDSAAVDHDLRVTTTPEFTPPADLAADDILRFPRGPLAGECLHAVLEEIDFADPATWRPAIDRALAASVYAANHVQRGTLAAMVERMLCDLVHTPLQDGIHLGEVPISRRLTELEFNLPSPHLAAPALNAMLARRNYSVPRLTFAALEGYLKGFIDLVLEHEGRFYIVDWKSNHLGYLAESYDADSLEHAMAEHGYHLQHLLYALALHRYLAQRLAGYRFDTHFGGVLYVFVRGVRPGWKMANGNPAGVHFHRLSAETLGELDQLFAGPAMRATGPVGNAVADAPPAGS